ncbi:MAG TPA: DUF1566 domain-containing protein [Xanthomonadales bacterium]|nr:DUF1566 domain-containing protein [Xanthomonadales bacterium]
MVMLRFHPLRIEFAVTASLLLAACSDSSAPGPEIHDTKYRAVSSDGQILEASVAPGVCVLDEFTGLTWEVKTHQPGLRHSGNTYSWYNPLESHDGELDYRGTANGGECLGSDCDTAAYVTAVNAAGLCGFDDWRMPSRDELGSISDPRKSAVPPSINLRYFPHTQPGEYWSANDYQFQWDAAWVWSFHNSLDRVEWKKSPRFVRLVRGQARQLTRVKD